VSDAALDILRSIDASLKQLLAKSRAAASTAGVANDSDLDGQYGDPIIKAADPRDWTGDSQKGNRYSQCPAAYLDLLADRLDYFAGKAEAEGKLTSAGKPVAPLKRKDAARARGWAKRIRDGFKPASVGAQWANDAEASMKAASPWGKSESVVDEDSIPF
jgi:hypothetical protein